jgi:phosphatidylglycerophosphate synthase
VSVPSISQLKNICRPKSQRSWFPRYVSRPISIYITKILLYTPVSANHVTVSMLILGVLGGILLIFNNYWYSICGALLLIISLILDCVDGEIARYRKTTSIIGKYLDRLTHIVVYPFMFIGLCFGAYTNSQNIWFLIFGFSTSSFTLLRFLLNLERLNILREESKTANERGLIAIVADKEERKGTGRSNFLRKLVGKVPDIAYDLSFTILIILIGAVLKRLDIVLIVYGIILPIRWLIHVISDIKFRL